MESFSIVDNVVVIRIPISEYPVIRRAIEQFEKKRECSRNYYHKKKKESGSDPIKMDKKKPIDLFPPLPVQ